MKIRVDKKFLFQLDSLFFEMQGFYSSNYLILLKEKRGYVYGSIFVGEEYLICDSNKPLGTLVYS